MNKLPSSLVVKNSALHGKGLFAAEAIKQGAVLFPAGDMEKWDNVTLYPVQMVNHSLQPNVDLKYKDKIYYAVAVKDINPGEELLLNYKKLNPLFLSKKDTAMLKNKYARLDGFSLKQRFGTDAENISVMGIDDDVIRLPYNYYLSQGVFQDGSETYLNAGGRRKQCKELGLKGKAFRDCTKDLRKGKWKKGQEVPLKVALKAEKAGGKPAKATAPTAFKNATEAAKKKALETFKAVQAEAQAGLASVQAAAQSPKGSKAIKYAGIALGGLAGLALIGFIVKKMFFKSAAVAAV